MKTEANQLLQNLLDKPNMETIILTMCVALVFSMIMWLSYKYANDDKTYRPQFGVTLIVLALITTILMDLIQSNLALSLGMLGSLSIVRFRTNIKDPRDIGFIFWSMAIGLAAATRSYFIGVLGCIILSIVMIATRKKVNQLLPMLLVVRGSQTDLDFIQETVRKKVGRSTITAKNILSDSFEIVFEVEIVEECENKLIDELFALGGIDSVNLLMQND